MNVVTLHVLRTDRSADFGLMRLAAPALEPEARIVVFEGLPPHSIAAHPAIAPTVLQGDLDGHRVYAEQLPQGLVLSELEPPASLATCVSSGLLDGLLALQAAGAVHGRIGPDRVFIGTDGQVVLFGRGRVGGSQQHDRAGAIELLATLGLTHDPDVPLADLHARLRVSADPTDRQALATLVRDKLPEFSIESHVHVQIGPSPDSLDEVQHDLGPDDSTSPGLLDRWAVTTHHGEDEHTAELTGSVGESSSPLALTLWTALAAPPEHPAPPDRFDAVHGEPSRGLRALLVEEPPDSLPGLARGRVEPFLAAAVNSTADEVTDSHPSRVYTPSELTPVDDGDDGDTAIYDLRERELQEAIRKADARTRLADLEARVSEAERRAAQAEKRAEEAERAARHTSPPPEPELGLAAFLRVELFVVVALVALMAWLAWRALG